MKKIFTFLLTVLAWQIMYGQGGVGIGTTTPHAPLQFASEAAERKIVLLEAANNDHQFIGFGVNAYGALKYQTNSWYGDHVFQSSLSDTTSFELMRLTGTGYLGLGTSPLNKLDVHFGTPRTGDHSNNRPLYVTGDIEEWNGIEFRHSNGTQGIGFGYNSIYATGSNEDQLLQFASRGNAPLIFKTDYIERMTISGDGNVGIGTYPDTPLNKLDIHTGPARTGTHGTGQSLYVTGDFANSFGVQFRQTDGTQGIGFANNIIYAAGSNDNQDMWLASKGPTGAVGFGTNGYARMYINGNGMVGIGMITPNAPLQFASVAGNRKIVLYENTNNDHQFYGFGINGDGSMRYQTGSNANDHVFYSGNGPGGSNELMRISGTGKVGLGVAPMNKLDIATGPTRTGTHPSNMAAYITANLVAPGIGFEIRHYDGTVGIGLGAQTMYAAGSNTDQDLNFLAKGPAGSLILKTNALERLVVKGSGNVGIGPSSMLNRLDINNGAAARTGTHGTGLAMYVTGDFGSASNGVEFRNNDAAQGIGFGSNTIYAAGTNATQDLNLAAKGASGSITFNTNNTEKVRITGSGNIGIGTASPNSPLQFASTAANRKMVLYEASNNDHQFIGLGNTATALRYQVNATASDHIFYAGTNPGNSSELMRIKGTGNVGIGTNAPNEKLEIANDGRAFFGDGGGVNRKGLLIDGIEANGARIEAYDYGTNLGIDLLLNPLGGKVGIGTSSPNASAAVDITSNSKGILIPRMTTTERNAIGSPANGLLVFDVTTNSFWFRRLSAWVELTDNLDTEVFRNGADKLYMGLTDSVGIGTMNPAYKLDVRTGNTQYGLAQTDGTIQLATWIGDGGEIGTVTNHKFRLYANNGLKQFELLPNGKIGIGLSDPLNRFDINNGAAARTGTHATGQALYVTGDFGSSSNGVQFRNNDGSQGIGFGYNTIYAAGSNASVDLSMAAKGASGNLIYATNGTEKMRITGSGNVGLGTTNINAALQFSNNLVAKKVVLYELANNANEYSGWGVGAAGSMLYQVPSENANFVFSTGAGANSSLELFKFGSLTGFQMNRNLTIDGGMTAWGNVTIGGNATIAGAVTIDSTITIEPFIAPTMTNFTNWGAGYATVAYYKDKMNRVHLRGLANRAANHNGVIIFTLPVGYRPSTSGKLLFTTQAASGMSRIDISTNGDVVVTAGSTGWISLDGISFRAD